MLNNLNALILSNFEDATGLSNDVSLAMAPKIHHLKFVKPSGEQGAA